MTVTPNFFVPGCDPSKQEAAYEALAQWAKQMGRIEIGRRIYSITFRGDGEEWTATVGEQLHGHTIANPRARAKKRQVERPLSDAATVRAIFAGASDFDSYIVVTDAGINPDVLSIFVNPFLAGSGPISVTYFTDTASV